ncbi:uncharacterized protein HD556DRAFT_1312664 [Suillus plorans]|uniref:Uncharacterized protein n=1 Tax=Suillus plorans TaxID=116603 RepID=A0A9P7AE36_9AGAM|nr:uncharacterized protein HD556DRAFT_1312664 [Suillus plorans]KAG1787465.1 hypothetical protein HD556DRAFT_1312664 [Suillus plorans]
MILRALSSQSASAEVIIGSSGVKDPNPIDKDTEEKDWEDMDFVDEVDEDTIWLEGDPTVEEDDLTDTDLLNDQAAYPILLNNVQIQYAKALREYCTNVSSTKAGLMEAYHSVILSVFTTATNHDLWGPLHSPIDSFIMATSINIQGHFVPLHLISSHLAKLIYTTMFSILTEVMKTSDPYKGHIALPRLQFTTFDGPDFTFDGKPLSVTSMTKNVPQHLLRDDPDAVLQHLKNPEEVVDQPHEHVIGCGVLASEMQATWNPLKFVMANRKLCKKYFSIDSSGNPVPLKGPWEEYLWQVEEFKECFYFLFHQIPEMPK